MTDQPNQDAGGIPYWPETQPDTDAPPTHTPGCSLSTAEASGHNRCGCWCHAGPPFRYMPDEVAAVLRPDLGRCHRETCEHGHVDHRPRNECRWCDCKAFVPSVAPQEGRPTTEAACPKCGHDVDHTTECPGGCPMCARYPSHPPRSLDEELTRIESTYPPSEGRPTTPQTEAGRPTTLREKVRQELDAIRSAGLSYDGIVADFDHAMEQERAAVERRYSQIAAEYIDASEAAAGALPSVEALAEALDAEMPVNLGPHEKFAAGVRRGMYRSLASRILARLASSEADRP
jgi:hypothetical protein